MKLSKAKAPAIDDLTSAVFDNGRRGKPKPGCDCEQCFGYCLVDSDKALRDNIANGDSRSVIANSELVFE